MFVVRWILLAIVIVVGLVLSPYIDPGLAEHRKGLAFLMLLMIGANEFFKALFKIK